MPDAPDFLGPVPAKVELPFKRDLVGAEPDISDFAGAVPDAPDNFAPLPVLKVEFPDDCSLDGAEPEMADVREAETNSRIEFPVNEGFPEPDSATTELLKPVPDGKGLIDPEPNGELEFPTDEGFPVTKSDAIEVLDPVPKTGELTCPEAEGRDELPTESGLADIDDGAPSECALEELASGRAEDVADDASLLAEDFKEVPVCAVVKPLPDGEGRNLEGDRRVFLSLVDGFAGADDVARKMLSAEGDCKGVEMVDGSTGEWSVGEDVDRVDWLCGHDDDVAAMSDDDFSIFEDADEMSIEEVLLLDDDDAIVEFVKG